MAKYSYEVYRKAFVEEKKLGEQILGYHYGWDIYKNEMNDVTLIMLAPYQEGEKPYNYNYNFRFDKFDSYEVKEIFHTLFPKDNESNQNDKFGKITFLLVFPLDAKWTEFRIHTWEPKSGQHYYTQFNGYNNNRVYTIKLRSMEQSGQIEFSPYGAGEQCEVLYKEIPLADDEKLNRIKNEIDQAKKNYSQSDWKRLLDRSYDKYKKYKNQDANKDDYRKDFENKLPLNNFKNKFFDENIRLCVYCGIKEEQLSKICKQSKRAGRGARLEYDRISDYNDYEIDNVVLACYWCNNAKTDEYSPNEFKEIARGINKIWNHRLSLCKQSTPDSENVEFPEYSGIWKNNHDYKNEKFCEEKVEE